MVIAARKAAPCLLILDNLDILLGGQNYDPADEPTSDDEDEENVNTNNNNKHISSTSLPSFRRDRTSHVAIDRLLSTLLVEIDGITGSTKPSAASSSGHSSTLQHPGMSGLGALRSVTDTGKVSADRVIVIATATDINKLDRYDLYTRYTSCTRTGYMLNTPLLMGHNYDTGRS